MCASVTELYNLAEQRYCSAAGKIIAGLAKSYSSIKQGCAVGVHQSLGFGPESRVRISLWRETDTGHVLSTMWCIVVQFNLQLKFRLYNIAHLLLEELRISLKSSLSTQSVCHAVIPGVRVGFWAQSRESRFFRAGVVVQSHKFSNPIVGIGVMGVP